MSNRQARSARVAARRLPAALVAALVVLSACSTSDEVRTVSSPADRERFCAEADRLLPPWVGNTAEAGSGFDIDAAVVAMFDLAASAPPETREQAHAVADHLAAVAAAFDAFDAADAERWDPANAQAALELVDKSQALRAMDEIADYCD